MDVVGGDFQRRLQMEASTKRGGEAELLDARSGHRRTSVPEPSTVWEPLTQGNDAGGC
jgi:hypothetical protein